MTTYLFSILTAGGDRMAQTDPHGFTLTIISVGVVFSALLILYFVYSLSGKIFSGEIKRVIPGRSDSAEVAAAIALALDMEENGDEFAAISAAVHMYLSDTVHDIEPGIVTIVSKPSQWNNKTLNFRQLPK